MSVSARAPASRARCEACHALDSGVQVLIRGVALLGGRADNARAERLREEEGISRARTCLRQHTLRVDEAEDGEAELRLSVDDGVSTCKNSASLGYLVRSARQYGSDRFGWEVLGK